MKYSSLYLLFPLALLTACGGGGGGGSNDSTPPASAYQDCDLSGYKTLSGNGYPANYFSGHSYSQKSWSNGDFDWYPLQLNIAEESTTFGHGLNTSEQTSEVCQAVATKLLGKFLQPSQSLQRELEVDLFFEGFNYATTLSSTNVEDKKITAIQPRLALHLDLLKKESVGERLVLESESLNASAPVCKKPFTVSTEWREGSEPNVDRKTETYGADGKVYTLTHAAKFTGDACTFDISGRIAIDGREEPVAIQASAELEKKVSESGYDRGYKLHIHSMKVY
ncbi:hypothetical protein [Hahella sp. NBU794]|uniref:hypothetical protein n=1 Tax=Hahella sp. NBU794 TaxID=3422590 RepID=UPI003D6F5C64